MPNFWQEIWNFFHRPKIETVEVVITIRDKKHHDSAYAEFKLKEGSHGSHY